MRKKNGERITRFSQRILDKSDALRSKRAVTRSSSCNLVSLYVKEVKKCDLMPFAASQLANAHPSAKFLFISFYE